MVQRPLGRTGIELSVLGFGAFKIGRNVGIKYERSYELPSHAEVDGLLHGVLDLGINYIDTAPAYGLSEERIGRAVSHRHAEFVVSTKVGEEFADGRSHFDFSSQGVRSSVDRSSIRLGRDMLDLVFVHSSGDDEHVLHRTDAVATLIELRDKGRIRAIGFSGKTTTGAMDALKWADALMVEYHLQDQSHAEVLKKAQECGVGIVVKKGLASGRLDAAKAIEFVLTNSAVTSLVVGGLDLNHIRLNARAAEAAVIESS
jgi:aryl-alcohol dehydrogenase-like predicted oxidoreductase